MKKFGKIALKTILWIVGSVIFLLLLLIFLIQIPSVQNFAVGKVTNFLENKIGTPVRIGYINIAFPKKLVLEDIYFEDQSQDTLLSGERILVDINMWKLLRNTVELKELELVGITAKIERTLPDSTFNFDYILEAFAGEEKAPPPDPEQESAMVFDLDKVLLERIRLVYDDAVIGTAATINLNHFNTRIKEFDLTGAMAFNIPVVTVDGLDATLRQWSPAQASDAPSADDFGITTADTSATSAMPALNINTVDLKNIVLKYDDQASGMDTRFDIRNFLATIEEVDLNREAIKLKEVTLDESDSYVLFKKINQTARPGTASQGMARDTPEKTQESSMNWVVSADKINIQKTNVWYKDENQPRTDGLDYFNLRLTDFEGNLSDLYFSMDSISGSLAGLTVKDHSGLFLKELSADFAYHNTGAVIENLHLETSKTLIRDRILVKYPSLDAISEDMSKIYIEADLRRSHIDMSDIRLLVPDLEKEESMRPLLDKRFHVNGRVYGYVNDLRIPNFEFRTLDNTHMIARARVRGLPDVDRFWIDLDLRKLTTGRRDIERLVAKSMLPENIELPASISLGGTFTGGMNGFDTDLSLITDQGNASVNGTVAMARDTTYNLSVAVNDLNIGKILGQDTILGIVAMEATVKGTGLNPETMSADINGKLNRLDAMDYRYQDITLAMNLKEGELAGGLESPDPNLDLTMEVRGNMRGAYPQIRAEMMVDSINFQNLKLMEDNFRYHGRIIADFETLDLDHLNGSLHIINSHIAYNEDRYILDTVALVSYADTSRNRITVESEFLKAHLVGDYNLSELGASISDVLRMYYNPSNNNDQLTYSPQQFEFSARLVRSSIIRDLIPELTEMSDITIDGAFNSDTKSLIAKILAPEVNYNGTVIEKLGADIITVDSTLYYNALIDHVHLGSIELTNTTISGSVIENAVDFGLWIRDKKNIEQYHLGAKMDITENNFLLSLSEDGLVLNYDKWEIEPTNRIAFGSSGVLVQNFSLTNNGQGLYVESQDSVANAPIHLRFDNFRIETFSQMVESEMLDFGGGIHGTATVSRLESSPVFVSDLTIREFTYTGQPIGDVAVQVNNIKENTFSADIHITGAGTDVQLVGDFISPPQGDAQIQASIELKPMQMKTVEAFSFGNLEESSGQINGRLDISGTTTTPRINGELVFDDARFNVSMLNATMSVDEQRIAFNNQGIQFKKFAIVDQKNNTAVINGAINTTDFSDFKFNLSLTMDDFEAMNSSAEDNELFYGKMYLTTNIKISGDINHPRVDGSIKVNENTDFVFVVPNDNPGIAERDGVVQFVSRSDSSRRHVFAKLDSLTTAPSQLAGMDVALNLQTDPEARFTVVLDPGTQDQIHIQGAAELTASVDASEKITMTGVYTVESGEYTVPLGPVSRKFTLRQGSTITWAGDPLVAMLNLTAVYRERFPTLELVQSQVGSEGANLYRQRIPFNVLLILTGEMLSPELRFDVELDEGSAIVPQQVTNNVNIALANIRNDEAELNKQVFSLIVLGRFMSANPFESLSGGGGVEGMARSTVSSMLSNQLNRLTSDLIKGVEIDFDLRSEQDYLSGSAQNRTDLNVGVSRTLFDDRLKISVGSNFEVEGAARPGEKTSNIAGNVTIDYQLTPDGRYVARAYRKDQYQPTLQGQFVETGLGLVLNMNYVRFRELFLSSKKLQDYYNQNSRSFRRRFDVERMQTDSVYRDSVRSVIRDSLAKHDPQLLKRLEEQRQQRQEQQRQQQNGPSEQNGQPADTVRREDQAVNRNDEDDDNPNEK